LIVENGRRLNNDLLLKNFDLKNEIIIEWGNRIRIKIKIKIKK
jgi:hypothetical protein